MVGGKKGWCGIRVVWGLKIESPVSQPKSLFCFQNLSAASEEGIKKGEMNELLP